MPEPIIEISVNTEEGKVYASLGSEGAIPTVSDVLEAVKAGNVSFWIDEPAIKKAIENKLFDQLVEIGHAKDGRVGVVVAPGEKEAYMVLEPARGGREPDSNDIEAALAEKQVTFGIDEPAMREALAEGRYQTKVTIARGKEPLNGTNASIEYLFRRDSSLKPKDTDDKRIDYRDLQSVVSVQSDAVLARKTPATRGEDGTTVTGRPIRAMPGKDVRLSPGKNVRLSEDGLELISHIDGQPVLLDKVAVEPVITIDGDVDYNTGNIDFAGSIRVLGSVISGFSVKATADIQIEGVVEDACIEAGGNVLVKGGIRGRGKKTVEAGGDVSALFIEQAHIEAGASIFAQEVLHSRLVAGDQVVVTKGKGLVFGGRIAATNLIHARTIGADSDIRTELSVGFNPKQKAALDALKENKSRHESKLAEVEIGIDTLDKFKASGSPLWQRHADTYPKLTEARENLQDTLGEISFQIGALEEKIVRSDHAHIKAARTVYPNVVVRIGRLRFQNESELGATSFYAEDGEIKSSVYIL